MICEASECAVQIYLKIDVVEFRGVDQALDSRGTLAARVHLSPHSEVRSCCTGKTMVNRGLRGRRPLNHTSADGEATIDCYYGVSG